MKSSYVKNAYINVSESDKTNPMLLLSMEGRGLVKIFSVFFVPAEEPSSPSASGLILYDSDPGSSGQAFYQDEASTAGLIYQSRSRYSGVGPTSLSPEGIVTECNDVYAQGTGMGVCFISILYQFS